MLSSSSTGVNDPGYIQSVKWDMKDPTKITGKCIIHDRSGTSVFRNFLEVQGFLDISIVIKGDFLRDIRNLNYEKDLYV